MVENKFNVTWTSARSGGWQPDIERHKSARKLNLNCLQVTLFMEELFCTLVFVRMEFVFWL